MDCAVTMHKLRYSGSLAKTLYDKCLADAKLQNYDKREWYTCQLDILPKNVSNAFLPLGMDEETEAFLEKSIEKSNWLFMQMWHSLAKAILSWFLTKTSINGLLGRGSMFVFSLGQFCQLLGIPQTWRIRRLIDLGAGDGRTTNNISPLFDEVFVTEVSTPMRWILARRGFRLLEINTWSKENIKPDVICCLNLLDRCERPLTLLNELRSAVSPEGKVLVALVLPYSPYVEAGTPNHEPKEVLPITGNTFEEQVQSVISNVFQPAGFHVDHWTKLPYLCEGDLQTSYYWLDDAVFVLSISN